MERSTENPALDIETLKTEAGVTPDFFEEPWMLDAYTYREIITSLAAHFADGDYELTYSTYVLRTNELGRRLLMLCGTFNESSGQTQATFREHLKRLQEIIPVALRKAFDMQFMFNYGEEEGTLIERDTIRPVTRYEYESDERQTRKLPYAPDDRNKEKREKLEAYADAIFQTIREAVSAS